MADRQLGKSRGPWSSLALTAAVFSYLLIAPVCAHAAGSVASSVAQLSTVVPGGAQAAVSAAVTQASAAPAAAAPAAVAAAVPAPVRAAADAASASVRAAAAAVPAPAPQAAPSMPHVSVPSVPAPMASRVNVPHVTVPSVPSPQSAMPHIPDPAPTAAAGAARRAGSVGAQLADAPRRSGARHEVATPSGHAPARPRRGAVAAHQASRRIAPPIASHPIAADVSVASAKHAGPFQPVRTARVPERRRPIVVRRVPARDIGITEASATAWQTVPTTASLPPGGAGGPSAGGSGGAAGGIAAAVLALAALALLRGFLPGLLALDVVPWRSALLAFRLERPG